MKSAPFGDSESRWDRDAGEAAGKKELTKTGPAPRAAACREGRKGKI